VYYVNKAVSRGKIICDANARCYYSVECLSMRFYTIRYPEFVRGPYFQTRRMLLERVLIITSKNIILHFAGRRAPFIYPSSYFKHFLQITIFLNILCHVDPLLDNDREIRTYATAIAN
jgi:hypothetical protein